MEIYFECLLAILSELGALSHNLILGVPKATPQDSWQPLQNMEIYFECLLAILSELDALSHNLTLGVQEATPSK